MNDKVKKIAIWVLIAFIVYAVFTSPDKSADIVRNIFGIIGDGAHSVKTFFDRILNG